MTSVIDRAVLCKDSFTAKDPSTEDFFISSKLKLFVSHIGISEQRKPASTFVEERLLESTVRIGLFLDHTQSSD